jgi:hypothetical protein
VHAKQAEAPAVRGDAQAAPVGTQNSSTDTHHFNFARPLSTHPLILCAVNRFPAIPYEAILSDPLDKAASAPAAWHILYIRSLFTLAHVTSKHF